MKEDEDSLKTADGVRCYVIELVNGNWRTEYLVSPRRGTPHLRVDELLPGSSHLHPQAPRLTSIQRRSARGPNEITAELPDVIKNENATHLRNRRVMRIVRFEPARAFAREEFALKVPLNADVTDRASGTIYRNDPWWPEIGRLLRDRFDWPKPDLGPLKDLMSNSGEASDGKEAPPVQAGLWLNSEPIDWAKHRGKVVLLHFTGLGGQNAEVSALKQLAEHYKPAGLEVVTILASYDDPDNARQYVRELKIAHPVAIDGPGEVHGATRAAFGIDYYATTLLVDHAGKVHRFERGNRSTTLVRLLREAGAV